MCSSAQPYPERMGERSGLFVTVQEERRDGGEDSMHPPPLSYPHSVDHNDKYLS